MINLNGKTVLITGASRGIGEAEAQTFIEAGANVMLTARDLSKLKTIKKHLGDRAEFFAGDISNPNFVNELVDFCFQHFGALDILINNAGTILPIGRIHEISPAEWSNVIDTNLKSVFYTVNAVLPKMIEKVKEAREKYPKLHIEVDGGVSNVTIRKLSKTGANKFVVGSYLQQSKDPKKTYMKLKKLIA